MKEFLKEYFGFYYLLFLVSYCSIFFVVELTALFNIAILSYGYFLIARKSRLDVVLALMLYTRCLNGFVVQHDSMIFNVVNFLTNFLPLLLYLWSKRMRNFKLTRKFVLVKYKGTVIFFLLLTLYFAISFSISQDLITKRYLPLLYFIIFLFFHSKQDLKLNYLLQFFRCTFVASLLVYLLSNYSETTQALMQSDVIFNVKSDQFAFVFFDFFRNLGIFWDHRILAIFCYLFLLLSLCNGKRKYFILDISLSAVVVVTSLARGGMITYFLILLAILFVYYRKYFLYSVLIVGLLTITGSVYIYSNDSVDGFIKTFDVNNDNNALTQRHGFADYALEQFSDSPLFGNGVGYVSSSSIIRNVNVGEVTYSVVTDAFWFSLLAEMGLLGFILFLYSYSEIFYLKNIVSGVFFLGFAIQLIGTDIPDMRFYYFAILVITFYVSNYFRYGYMETVDRKPYKRRLV